MCFKRDPNGRWGLEPQRWADGRSNFWRPLREAEKPWLLRGQDHGTQVVLLGEHERHDTTQPPQSVTDARQQWITRYLNSRFLRLPEQVEVLVREHRGRDQPGPLQRIHGERHHVERHAIAAGGVQLSDAIAYWWVLDDDARGRRREAGLWASSGHAAAVFGDELYDVLPQMRGGYGRLQDFGVRFGYERVVLHLEPQLPTGRLEANTARTLLLLDHEPLPWSRWGEEFAAAMPEQTCDSKNAPRAPRAFRARKRSGAASARSFRSTASAATGPRNRHNNHGHGQRLATAPNWKPPRPLPSRPPPTTSELRTRSAEPATRKGRTTWSAASRSATAR